MIRLHITITRLFVTCSRAISAQSYLVYNRLGKLVRLADLEGGVHEAFFLFLLTTQMHFAIISGQH